VKCRHDAVGQWPQRRGRTGDGDRGGRRLRLGGRQRLRDAGHVSGRSVGDRPIGRLGRADAVEPLLEPSDFDVLELD